MWWLSLAATLALQPTNDACNALCIRDGYDFGFKKNQGCVCYKVIPKFDDFLAGRITLGAAKVRVANEPEPEPE